MHCVLQAADVATGVGQPVSFDLKEESVGEKTYNIEEHEKEENEQKHNGQVLQKQFHSSRRRQQQKKTAAEEDDTENPGENSEGGRADHFKTSMKYARRQNKE